ncbi:diguanylate cyclase, partial [Klebsiella michiganensis]|uniref:diguanylate cyclase n=1 Tax=Klebsiella michiganensis TaxID=1134687 RepID=UPI001E287874
MVGDRAIKHVAELLSDNIRSSDYIFRYGGEEFLLVLLAGVASAADTQTFTDDLGRTVTVPLHPQRIVSLHDLDI